MVKKKPEDNEKYNQIKGDTISVKEGTRRYKKQAFSQKSWYVSGEAEAGGSQIGSQSRLHSEFWVNLGYIAGPCHKMKQTKAKQIIKYLRTVN